MDWPLRGPWTAEEVGRFLRRSVIPLRLACPDRDGYPMISTQWFILDSGQLLCAAQRDSYVASRIRREQRCAFEISSEVPPYCGVRGRAVASLDDVRGPAVLDRLIDRYVGQTRQGLASWLRSRSANETAIVLEPLNASCWDYRGRMDSDA